MKGDVTLYEKSIPAYKPTELAEKLAILPQGAEATEGMTVRELFEFGRNPYKCLLRTAITDEEDGIINRAIEVTGLSQFANRTLESLSGGQRQRAWIAMTLTQESDIILLDEPTTYLDLAYQIETLNLLKRLNEVSSKTIVIVLHELNQAAKYADYLVCMKQGKIHAEGEVDKVFTAQLIKDVFDLETIIIKNPVCDRPMCIPL